MNGGEIFQDLTIAQMGVQGNGYVPVTMNTQINGQPSYAQQFTNPQIGPYQQMMPQQPMNPIPRQTAVPTPRTGPQPKVMAPDYSPENRNLSPPFIANDGRDYRKGPPSAGTVTTSPMPKRPSVNHHGVSLRDDKIPRKTHGKKYPHDVEPEMYYGPSPPKPQSWGPLTPKKQHLFTYTEKGELAPGLYLTRREMKQYLMGPGPNEDFDPPARLPGVKSTRKRRQGLTLWIGWPAAMANSRYPRAGESTKCRFKDCKYKHTIALGEPWVILDERQNVHGEYVDPFHNAGYVHLFCLEHHFDLIDLWHLLDVRVDARVFKRESHPYFSLEHKLPGIDSEVRCWWMKTYDSWCQAKQAGKKRVRDHKASLSARLIKYKLDNEPRAQARNRARRGGVDMSKHEGDPELKRLYKAYQKHKLLDVNGNPVKNAEEKLKALEGDTGGSKTSVDTGVVSPQDQPQPQPMQNNGQQFHPYGQQQQQPTYAAQPVYPIANPVYHTQPVPQAPYVDQAPIMPPRQLAGQKRYRDDQDINQTLLTTSPKRQRLVEIPNVPVDPLLMDPTLMPPPPQPQPLTHIPAAQPVPQSMPTKPSTGQKRCRDNDVTEDPAIMPPSPKRQRPEDTAVPQQHTRVSMHGESAPLMDNTTNGLLDALAAGLATATTAPNGEEASNNNNAEEVSTAQQPPHDDNDDAPHEQDDTFSFKNAEPLPLGDAYPSPPLGVDDLDDLFGAPEDSEPLFTPPESPAAEEWGVYAPLTPAPEPEFLGLDEESGVV
ncbi:hypothetical protein F5Y09DRAFT_326847 [Xylaria sp. FL1042]|nr:hypothetical protein F5Y09DRAFT_326847 [Xylaria sp. FL1042]